MKLALRVITVTSVAALWLTSAGCGSSQHGTATILGTVSNASTQRFQVKVEGTNVSTTTNSHGQFTLNGVPSGNVTLHFVSNGVDVRLEVSGLTEGMTMRITVHINGSHATMARAPNEITLSGTIESIADPNFTISGLTVITNADTKLKQGGHTINFADLAVGQLVRVQGTLDTDGNVVATLVQVVSPEQAQIRIRGLIDSITPPDLTISGLTITTDANTHFQGTSLANLAVGDAVQVDGTLQADGTVLARSIKKIAQEEGDDNEGDDDQGDDD